MFFMSRLLKLQTAIQARDENYHDRKVDWNEQKRAVPLDESFIFVNLNHQTCQSRLYLAFPALLNSVIALLQSSWRTPSRF